MEIIQAIKKGTGLNGYAGNFLGYISCWLSMHKEVRVTHILREGNGPADFMAVRGPEGIIVEYIWVIYRPDSRSLLRGSVYLCEPHTHTIRGIILRDTCIGSLIICYVCEPHTHIIRDYKSFTLCVNARLVLLLYVCVTHTHEPNPRTERAGPRFYEDLKG